MAGIEEARVELAKLEKEALIELIVSGTLPDNFDNNTVRDYLEEKSLLECEDKANSENAETDYPDLLLKGLEVADPSKEDYYWRNYIHNNIPEDAVDIAKDEYIGQITYEEHVLPVVIFPKENLAIGERNGKRTFHENIKILCSPDSTKFYWEYVDLNNPNEYTYRNAVKGGYQDGYDLYIGRGLDRYQTSKAKIGKVVPTTPWKGLQVWGNCGECVVIMKFHMLKCGTFKEVIHEDSVLTGFYWRDYVPSKIPKDAIEVSDGKYIGQISLYGDIPVTIDSTKNIAIGKIKGKKTVFKENIKILCTSDPQKFYWEPVEFEKDNVIKRAVVGGCIGSSPLFVGKIFHEEEWKIGRVIISNSIGLLGLNVWDKQDELMLVDKFELLKYDAEKVLNK